MVRVIVLAVSLLFAVQPGRADDVSGHAGLALAALVAASSPALAAPDKSVMAALFDGKTAGPFAAGKKITIQADGVVCAAGNVDITHFSCDLTFGGKSVSLSGRQAHEMYATIGEIGVPEDGAMGKIYEGLSHLTCTVDPNEVKQATGEGVSCTFTPGPP
jgi:hypothetical protein